MPKLIHSKYGYETPEWTAADARLEKWLKQKKEEKRRSDERRILLQEEGNSHEDQKHTNRQ